MQQIRKFAFDVGWVLVSSMVSLAIAFLLKIVLARWLGPADLGLYSMVITINEIASLFANLGIQLALTRYAAKDKDNRDALFQITSNAFICSIIFGLVVSALLFVLSTVLAGIFHMPELAQLLKILALVFPFTSIFLTSLGLFNGLRQMKTYAYLMILRSCLMILGILVLAWLGFGVRGAVFGVVISVLGGCAFGLYSARKYFHPNFRGFYQGMKILVSFGSQIFITDAVGLILTYTGTLMIGYYLAAEDVGYYSVAVSLSNFFLIIPQAIQRVTFPATSRYWSENNLAALRKMIDKSMKYSACIMLPVGLVVGFFAREIITLLFGQEFILAALPLCILVIARVIRGSTTAPIGACFSGIGRPDIPFKISAVSAGVNIGLNVLFIPSLGIAGAALATTISILVQVVIFQLLMPRILGVGMDIKWYARALGFACMAVVLFLVGSRLTNLYAVGVVILCVYTVLVIKVFLTKEDRAMLGSLAYSVITSVVHRKFR